MDVERLKRWYESGLWTDKMVRTAVVKKKLTPEQYAEITGKPYEEVGA